MCAHKRTKQKAAIRQVFASALGPLGPSEILDEARKTVPSLGIATVYRVVKELKKDGWLQAVQTPVGSRFQTTSKVQSPRFFCRTCQKTFNVDGDVGKLAQLAPKGFIVKCFDLTIVGTCSSCAVTITPDGTTKNVLSS
jgi:Fur family ferric uptake transcriptional regulator